MIANHAEQLAPWTGAASRPQERGLGSGVVEAAQLR